MDETLCFRCMRGLEKEDELHLLIKTCEKCFNVILSSPMETVSDYLASLRIPAALIAQDQTVLSSNERFQRMAPNKAILGQRLGEVLECMYAPILGRCGETVACLVCKLRRSIETTLATGEGLRGVPFSFPHKEEGRKTFSISTEIVSGAVLLLMGAALAIESG